MNKKFKSLIAVYVIIFVLFNILFFVIPFTKSGVVWFSYAFTLAAIAFGLCAALFAFTGRAELRSKVYGLPVFGVGAFYMVIQLIVTVVLCAINSYVHVPVWIGAVLGSILLAFALIGVIITDNVRDIVEATDIKTEQKIKTVTLFKLDISSLAGKCTDSDTRKKLLNLSDELRYSDPVSSDELAQAEQDIKTGIEELAVMLESGDKAKTEQKIEKISTMLADRNRRCKALKK